MKERHILGAFDWFLIIGVVVCNVIYSIVTAKTGFDGLGFTAAVAGIVCVVLAAKGSIWNYAFGIVQVSLYAYIAWKSRNGSRECRGIKKTVREDEDTDCLRNRGRDSCAGIFAKAFRGGTAVD